MKTPALEYDAENKILTVHISDHPMAFLKECCENTHVEYRKGGIPRAFVFTNVPPEEIMKLMEQAEVGKVMEEL